MSPRSLAAAALHLVLLAGVRPGYATTRVVPDTYPSVQSAIDASASGDTIKVRAGVYPGAITLANKNVTIVGEPGDVTRFNRHYGGRILEIGAHVSSTFTLIQDIVFEQGVADRGGAVSVAGESGVRMKGCSFTNNTARSAVGGRGGAVWVGPTGTLELEDCEFRNNYAGGVDPDPLATGYGGAVYSDHARIDAERCTWSGNATGGFEGGFGGGVYLYVGGATIMHSLFEGNSGAGGGAIYADSPDWIDVTYSVFRENQSLYDGASCIEHTGLGMSSYVSDCVFHDNTSMAFGAVELLANCAFNANTVVFNRGPSAVRASDLSPVTQCIIAFNEGVGFTACGSEPPQVVRCNDVWGNAGGNYQCMADRTGIEGNLSEDPLFCDAANRLLGLRPGSPCASPPGCFRRMGALLDECVAGVPTYPPIAALRLGTPWPNPLGTRPGRIGFDLAVAGKARLTLLDVQGRHIATLADGEFPGGHSEVFWPVAQAPRPGVYLLVLTSSGERRARRVVVQN